MKGGGEVRKEVRKEVGKEVVKEVVKEGGREMGRRWSCGSLLRLCGLVGKGRREEGEEGEGREATKTENVQWMGL